MDKSIYTGELFGEKISLQRISKAKAKKTFMNGKSIFLESSNMHPFNAWQPAIRLKYNPEYWEDIEDQFETMVNSYLHYNCDNERGKYIHFYAKVM